MTFEDAYSRVRTRSWLSEARLRALWESTKAVIADDVPGAIVECGCATGGSAALLGMASEGRRPLYLFDSFEGMP
jgi:O-methyltransferase